MPDKRQSRLRGDRHGKNTNTPGIAGRVSFDRKTAITPNI
jgi:hypothetical protein